MSVNALSKKRLWALSDERMLWRWESISEGESMGRGVCGDGCGNVCEAFEGGEVDVIDGGSGDSEGLRV